MPVPHALATYKQTQAHASTPLELVVMLYDGTLRFMSVASDAIGRRDVRGRRDAIDSVLRIVGELTGTLDLERGGPIAAELEALYGFVSARVMDSAMQNDVRPLAEARRVIEVLRDGWQTIATAPAGRQS